MKDGKVLFRILYKNKLCSSGAKSFANQIYVTGTPIRSTMDNTSTTQYTGGMKNVHAVARSMIRDLDVTNDLLFLRIRTKKFEIMMTAGGPRDYLLKKMITHR